MVGKLDKITAALVEKGVPKDQAPFYTLTEAQLLLGATDAALNELAHVVSLQGLEAATTVLSLADLVENYWQQE